jgi:hypothetical protein
MAVTNSKPSVYVPSFHEANQKVVNTYVCLADPSMYDGAQQGSKLAGTSYSANGRLFGNTDSTTGRPLEEKPWDRCLEIGKIKDGASNTIAFTHAYARCGSATGSATAPASGAVWGYYNNGLPPSGIVGPPIFMYADISGNANVGNGIKVAFQVKPTPYDEGFTGNRGCDPALPATPHSAGTLVLLCDGGTRVVSPNVAPLIWWQACLPDDGAAMPADW